MRLQGEEYSKRLSGYSDDTIRLISQMHALDMEHLLAATAITTDSTLTEEQVVAKLLKLKASAEQGVTI